MTWSRVRPIAAAILLSVGILVPRAGFADFDCISDSDGDYCLWWGDEPSCSYWEYNCTNMCPENYTPGFFCSNSSNGVNGYCWCAS